MSVAGKRCVWSELVGIFLEHLTGTYWRLLAAIKEGKTEPKGTTEKRQNDSTRWGKNWKEVKEQLWQLLLFYNAAQIQMQSLPVIGRLQLGFGMSCSDSCLEMMETPEKTGKARTIQNYCKIVLFQSFHPKQPGTRQKENSKLQHINNRTIQKVLLYLCYTLLKCTPCNLMPWNLGFTWKYFIRYIVFKAIHKERKLLCSVVLKPCVKCVLTM